MVNRLTTAQSSVAVRRRRPAAIAALAAVAALTALTADAAPKQVQEHVAMASEHRSEHVGLPFVRSEPFQFFAGTAAPVIEQDRRKRSLAGRAPK